MKRIVALVTMLHEPPAPSSLSRRFRGQPVLAWTLRRLQAATRPERRLVLCWDDQAPHARTIARACGAEIVACGQRDDRGPLEAVSAAQRWSGGWRGGLLQTCDFDAGFDARHALRACGECDAALLVDAASALVDPVLVDRIAERAAEDAAPEIVFAPAAPGLAGPALAKGLLERLAPHRSHAGRLLHYMPDVPVPDPLTGFGCVAVPPALSRTSSSFKLDSERQIAWITAASLSLNGTLMGACGDELVARLDAHRPPEPFPRDITLELTTERATAPLFLPRRDERLLRAPASPQIVRRIAADVATCDGARLTLGGVGDPVMHPDFTALMQAIRDEGVAAVHVETDLFRASAASIEALLDGVDVVSVLMPAMRPSTYDRVMGVDALQRAVDRIAHLLERRAARGRGTPIVVPRFVRCLHNAGEMEAWYDQWLRALGCAVIEGASRYGGLVEDVGSPELAPARRIGCRRLGSRMMVLSDGRVTSCEQDVCARQVVGDLGSSEIREVWQGGAGGLRALHAERRWDEQPVCGGCREWDRP